MSNHEDVANQRDLLDAHRQTLGVYMRREALQGVAHAPPEVTTGMREARAGIARCKANLRSWGEVVEDLPDDVTPDQPLPAVAGFRPLVVQRVILAVALGLGGLLVILVMIRPFGNTCSVLAWAFCPR